MQTKRIKPIHPFAALVLILFCASAFGQTRERSAHESTHSSHAGHQSRPENLQTPLSEPGQGAFAALAEVISTLAADSSTDWAEVDIDALREHLVSMDRLVLNARVETTTLNNGYRYRVTGTDRTRQAIREMVPAHAKVLAVAQPWRVVAERTDEGATLTVRSEDAAEQQRIGALGFFGLMATGDHHRAHHWAIANGRPM